jgi:threonine synthase
MDLKNRYILSSANSINVARLLPQSFYYFNAFTNLPQNRNPVVISVPCGNFGNLTAGIIAKKLGLPIEKFIAAVNQNDVFKQYMTTGDYKPKTAVRTLSNAMDVGNPSNFDRILDVFDHDFQRIKQVIVSYSVSDDLTKEGIKEVYDKYGYMIDPHGAVGYQSLKMIPDSSDQYIILETAHPAKFLDIVSPVINKPIKMPERLKACLDKPKNAIPSSINYQEFKSKLLKWID